MPENVIFVTPYGFQTELFNGHENLSAKLSNSIADLNWYTYRLLIYHGYQTTARTALETLKNLRGEFNANEACFDQILKWYGLIAEATPEIAESRFYDCWKFLHNSFDKILSDHV